MISEEGKERARLLAVDLVSVKRDKDREEFRRSINSIKEGINEVSNSLANVFSQIKKDVSQSLNSMKGVH